MNSELRGAIYRKHMLYTQYTKQRNAKTWEKFRQQRNLVTKLKKKSMKNYFLERCSGGAKTCNFWTTVKPFFSKKCNSGEQKIILCVICTSSFFYINSIYDFFNSLCCNILKVKIVPLFMCF
jgi:hypothetical protein